MERGERLIYLIVSSIVIGLVVGKLIYYFETKIDDAPIEITVSLIAPYFAYLAAESAHSSGVLATVVCGLYLGHKSSLYLSIGARLKGYAVWDTLTFILNGFVFILIGLQLPIRSRRNSRILAWPAARPRSLVQRCRDPSPPRLGVSRSAGFEFHSAPYASSAQSRCRVRNRSS